MFSRRLPLAIGVCVCCLTACRSSQPCAPKPDVEVGASEGTAPPSEYREALLRQAMRGLRYESGRVEIDEPVAAAIAQRGTREQALVEYERGKALLRRNMRIQAIEAHTRAVLIAPDEAVLYEGLGAALLAKDKTAEAIAAYRTALDLDPRYSAAHFGLADALQRQRNFNDAAAAYREVIQLDPNHAPAHTRLAVLLYYLDDDAGAWAHVHRVEALGSSVPAQFRELLAQRTPEPSE
jgi:tetratricopeptide (TPR) repeat protein